MASLGDLLTNLSESAHQFARNLRQNQQVFDEGLIKQRVEEALRQLREARDYYDTQLATRDLEQKTAAVYAARQLAARGPAKEAKLAPSTTFYPTATGLQGAYQLYHYLNKAVQADPDIPDSVKLDLYNNDTTFRDAIKTANPGVFTNLADGLEEIADVLSVDYYGGPTSQKVVKR